MVAGVPAWAPGGGGGGGSGNGLLAVNSYGTSAPGIYSRGTVGLIDVDAANMAVTFSVSRFDLRDSDIIRHEERKIRRPRSLPGPVQIGGVSGGLCSWVETWS